MPIPKAKVCGRYLRRSGLLLLGTAIVAANVLLMTNYSWLRFVLPASSPSSVDLNFEGMQGGQALVVNVPKVLMPVVTLAVASSFVKEHVINEAKVALRVEDLDTGAVVYETVVPVKDFWRPDMKVESAVRSDLYRLVLPEGLKLSRGEYRVLATVFAEPPYGSGRDERIPKPMLRFGLPRDNVWLRPGTSMSVLVEVHGE